MNREELSEDSNDSRSELSRRKGLRRNTAKKSMTLFKRLSKQIRYSGPPRALCFLEAYYLILPSSQFIFGLCAHLPSGRRQVVWQRMPVERESKAKAPAGLQEGNTPEGCW